MNVDNSQNPIRSRQPATNDGATNGTKRRKPTGHCLITGGAGFIGSNLAERLLEAGERVVLYDTLTREGVEQNVRHLSHRFGSQVRLRLADVRDIDSLTEEMRHAESVFHLAAQVAVTSSISYPELDFEVNARGTLNVLEAMRRSGRRVPLVFTSTNKVYGALEHLALEERPTRWMPTDAHSTTISETAPLTFCSPYGCSKGAADQYVLDYARTFGLPAVVFRMSCIYGPHQFGTEDQGWVAHFLLCLAQRQPLTIFGDGKQVRDVLFVDDLVAALLLARTHSEQLRAQAFNIGGGYQASVSLLELFSILKRIGLDAARLRFADWRPGDQRYYVSDISRFSRATGWTPQIRPVDGVSRLARWLLKERVAPASSRAPLDATPPQ
ncbi:MAG: NAD-dependent epimerase/dehydratase family protein [Bdellovibrionales bacterium]|nr:NAD-dependent epimerase/dehydratase family protein [Bdellovibrionales bacterium]